MHCKVGVSLATPVDRVTGLTSKFSALALALHVWPVGLCQDGTATFQVVADESWCFCVPLGICASLWDQDAIKHALRAVRDANGGEAEQWSVHMFLGQELLNVQRTTPAYVYVEAHPC